MRWLLKWLRGRAKAAAGAAAAQRDAKLAEAIGLHAAAEAIRVPPEPRLLADDVTAEAATSWLAELGRIAVVSAEGGLFDLLAGRYSRMPNIDVWLKGHSGDSIRVDRKGRAAEVVTRPVITIGLMIQPAVLRSIGSHRVFSGRVCSPAPSTKCRRAEWGSGTSIRPRCQKQSRRPTESSWSISP